MIGRLLLLAMLTQVSHASEPLLFETNSILEVKLNGPLSSLFEDVNDEEQLPFSLYANGNEHAIKVRVRGNSRKRECSFPPLRLNFESDDAAESIFAGQDKLKLVTHCLDRHSSHLDILQEYTAYRIFNLISDMSYRVRLLHITYTDTAGDPAENTFEHYGFLLESSEELAHRMGAQPVEVPAVSLQSLHDKQEALVYVFQYLIGNTDWSLVTADTDDSCCHNGDLFDIGPTRYYVPYDFDLSGLVNSHYARPDASLRLRNVRERLYRGFCLPEAELQEAINKINIHRTEILEIVRQLPDLPQKDIDGTIKYLEQFFSQAENEEKLARSLKRKCL